MNYLGINVTVHKSICFKLENADQELKEAIYN